MFKFNKVLIKRGFKSIFKTKLFSIMMMILILITGTTYTMLSQSTNSFKKSYNEVLNQGHLHDNIIKSGFRFTNDQINNSKLNYGPTTATGYLYVLDDHANPPKLADIQALANEDKSVTGNSAVYFEVKPHTPTGIYQNVDQSVSRLYLDKNIAAAKSQITSANLKQVVANLISKIKDAKDNILTNLEAKLSTTVIDKIYDSKLSNGQPFSDSIYLRDTHSLFVQNDTKSFNVVDQDINPIIDPTNPQIIDKKYVNDLSQINNLVIYDGTSSFTQPLTDNQFKSELEWLGADFNAGWTLDKSKDFRQVARPPTSAPTTKAITFTDPLAYQAVVSPGYANRNNKKAIDMNQLVDMLSKDPTLGDKIATDKALQAKYKDNLVTVDNTPYFIIGIGTRPDYMYPIMNQREPVVDEKNQAVVFVANRGYERIQDAFRSNPTENYISLRFKSGVSKADQNYILTTINNDLQGNNGFPVSVYANSDVKLITSATESGDKVLLVENRVSTLDKIKNTVSSLSYATTTLLILFLLSIIIMIFKALISGSRKIFATLHALGYSKIKIALSNALTAIALMALPMLLAYGIGYGFQFLFINQFANTWTIPTYRSSFNWITLLVIIALPTLILFVIIVAITLFELRFSVPKMLNGSADFTFSGIAQLTSRLKPLSIKSKYVVALSLKNIGKLALMTTSALIAMSALIIGIGTIGRADYAYQQTAQMNKYEYAVDFVSPTVEGGQYTRVNPYDPNSSPIKPGGATRGRSTIPDIPATHPNPTPPYDPSNKNPVAWQVPQSQDTIYTIPSDANFKIDASSQYLNNMIQNKAILDTGNLSSNGLSVWEIAERLMPDNQKNQANNNFNLIMHKIFDASLGYNAVDDKSIDQIITTYISKNPGAKPADVKKMIVDYYNDHLIKGNTDDSKNNPIIPYTITYNHILTNKSDESYTYLDGYSDSVKQKVNIKGIKDNQMVKVNQKQLDNLTLTKNGKNQLVIPILVNKYLEKSWNVHVGSTLSYDVDNSARRYADKTKSKINVSLKVAGIINGYNDTGIYTSQKIANSVLGLNLNQGFNGVFSTAKSPIALSTLSLYSPSGLYFPTDSFATAQWKSVLDKYLKSSSNKLSIKDANTFINTYKATPFLGLTSNVRCNTMDKLAFENVTTMTSTIIAIIEAISIVLSVLFTAIVAALLFKTNSKKIAALWALGYRKREINRMFISMYIVPLILAIMIAIPISIAVFAALQLFIISFGHILIPLTLTWWMPLVALGGIALIFIGSTSLTVYTRGTKATLEAFKGD